MNTDAEAELTTSSRSITLEVPAGIKRFVLCVSSKIPVRKVKLRRGRRRLLILKLGILIFNQTQSINFKIQTHHYSICSSWLNSVWIIFKDYQGCEEVSLKVGCEGIFHWCVCNKLAHCTEKVLRNSGEASWVSRWSRAPLKTFPCLEFSTDVCCQAVESVGLLHTASACMTCSLQDI